MSRTIGIRHQEKATVGGEVRPTQFCILEYGKQTELEFEDVSSELGWLVGKLPISYREVIDPSEDISEHDGNIKFGPKSDDESTEGRHPSQIKVEKKRTYLARKVPAVYDGVRADDTYVAMMGGSGHQLVAGLSDRLEKLGGSGKVCQVPPIRVCDKYGLNRDKDKDAQKLLELFVEEPSLFYPVVLRDRKIAQVKSTWALRKAAQRARIAHGQRLRKVAIMEAYARPEFYVGAGLEVETLSLLNGDEEMDELKGDENQANRRLKEAIEDTEVWQLLLSQVEGCGPAIAGGLISAIGDIRRFHRPGQLAKYCGVGIVTHDKDGKALEYATIQRRRSGEYSGWQNDARKCLWNFAEQCNRRPSSVWGAHLLRIKAKILEKYPEPVQSVKDGVPAVNDEGKPKMRYTRGHIHKIAIWRLQTDFIWWIWREWGRIYKYGAPKDFRPPGNRGTEIVTPDLAEAPAKVEEPVAVG